MVTRNRNDEAGADGWWDDLPPMVKRRVSRPESSSRSTDSETECDHRPPTTADHRFHHPSMLADLTRLVGLILAVAAANLAFLLVALSFLSGRGPFGF